MTQRWLDVDFDDFAASEPEAHTAQPMIDDEIVDLVCTENDAPQEESEDEEEENPITECLERNKCSCGYIFKTVNL